MDKPEPVGVALVARSPRYASPRRGRSARRIFLATGLVVLGLIVGSGLALASWNASGVGAGSAATGVSESLTLAPGTPAVALYPGGRAEVILTMSNPNTSAVTVANLALDPTQGNAGFAVDAAHAACGTTSLSYTTQTNAGAGWTVPARTGAVNGDLSVSLADALSMSVGAPNSCQGAQFTVYLVASS